MIRLRCQNCGRIVTTDLPEKKWTNANCTGCDEKGQFAEIDSEEDTYEENSEEEPEEEEEYTCEECGDDFKEKDIIGFKDAEINLCKKCIDKKYQRQFDTKIEYKDREKIIEVPIYLDKEGNRIDHNESKPIFPKLF